jgi:HEPN domain-containing protein
MRLEADDWWRQAEADLSAAEFNLSGGQWFVVVWLAQQSVEKGLKCLYLQKHGQSAPFTHDLVHLGQLLSVPSAVNSDLATVGPAFQIARYPFPTGGSPVDQIDELTALSYLEPAKRVMTWIASQLPSR